MTSKERLDALVGSLQATCEAATATSVIAASMVQLSYFAYNEPVDTIPDDVAHKVSTPVPNAHWRCVWGPAIDADDGNLLYVAGLFAGTAADPAGASPFAVAVVSRGTADPSLAGLLEDLYEDATPVPQERWLNAADRWIANGSVSALWSVISLTSNGQTLLGYLANLPQVDGHEPIILVTGHSLGGCIASVLAPWLVANLPTSKTAWLTPITFAGPTAGSKGFVDALVNACPLRQIYVNPLDVVPKAWWDIGAIPDIYGGWYTDPAVYAWAGATILALDALAYPYAPVPSPIPPLPGTFINIQNPIIGLEWFEEAYAQHSCANYMLLMGLVPPYAFSADAPKMQRLEGGQREALETLVGGGVEAVIGSH
ncbi:hypothetical protein [Sphingosinicella sp. BN140058]|uniref:lipase family protein n=1 Tax=Sphingosinicella sp. BN140058 TaxID=1892855 RepID=UPI0010112FE4|nr:hypothetical protein [Sphingosinicella sp. BN140058]QAY77359.1 hypothetical protein ETR14_13220 [Sphingosinicella sp. BN140058]